MISFKARAESLERTENELKSEMAAALGRISGTLTNLIADLARLREEIIKGSDDEKRRHYRETHECARLYYWYLMIQRESIGIRNHNSLRELYAIPPLDI